MLGFLKFPFFSFSFFLEVTKEEEELFCILYSVKCAVYRVVKVVQWSGIQHVLSILILACSVFFSMSGCWNRVEVFSIFT